MLSAFQKGAFQRTGFQIAADVVAPEDDYESHWHYAKAQRKRRAAELSRKSIPAIVVVPEPVPLPEYVIALPTAAIRSTVDQTASVSVWPVIATSGDCSIEARISSIAGTRVLPLLKAAGSTAYANGVETEGLARAVNVLDELRDMEDMMDLYQLLLAA